MVTAILPKPRPPAANAPLRRGCTPADSARLDALQARAKQLSGLRRMNGDRYLAALREMTSIMAEVISLQAAYQANHGKFEVKHNPATPFRMASWFVRTTEQHPTPGRVLSIHHDIEAAQSACDTLRTHQHRWVLGGSHRAPFHVCDVCSIRKDDEVSYV